MSVLEKVEDFLIDLGISYQELSGPAWLVEDESKGLPPMVVSRAGSVVTIRSEVMDIPASNRESFYAKLLELNATDLIHGAYAIDGGKVYIVDTLEYENMDKTELGASLEAIGFALSEHYPVLSRHEGR